MVTSPQRRRAQRTAVASAVALAVAGSLLTAPAAQAANTDIGYPTFRGSSAPVPDTGVAYTPGNQLQRIFDADVQHGAGATAGEDFWFDRMLVRTGTDGTFGDNNQWLFTRGRAAFMKEHDPAVLGFGGQLAYWEAIDGRGGFTVTARIDGSEVRLTEDTAQRTQTPSYWRSVHRDAASGLEVVQTKFITDANVLVTNLALSSPGARDVELRVGSPYADRVEGAELVGDVDALNDLTTLHPRLSGEGFAPVDGALTRTVSVPAGGTAEVKVQLGLVTDEIAASRTEYDAVRASTPAEAYGAHVTAYNRWWAENVPYLDTPEDNIDKSLYYRWWLMRYNFLDADIPGNTYQFPTSMEGVLGYNNAIVLTTGMFIDDLKYFRDPIYSYGPWVSAGETSKSYKFVDNPGDPANWSNSYTQYISEAALRAYQLHGGPTPIAQNLAEYAELDVEGLIDAYDFNDNGLIEYNWGAMTGNDADAVSFHYKPGYQDRTENAYLYSNALAAAEAYEVAGDPAKAAEMTAFAARVKEQVMEVLWNPERKLLEHAMADTGEHVPWKEINNYYPFTVGLVPKPGDPDYDDDYVDALRLFADDEQYPIFPFYTANQADQAAYGGPGSNNFSVINSTVTFRMLSRVLREYPSDAIDEEWYKKLLYWNAWSHFQNGDNRLPDQNEFWANGSAEDQTIGYRSWIHHTILGATNFTVIEDAMGLRPRSDAKIELDPIAVDWDHFTANNIRLRDRDLTVTWDAPGGERHYGDDVPEGYSVFLDGRLAFTVDSLAHVVYDPQTGTVEVQEGDAEVLNAAPASLQQPQDVRFDDGARVVDLFAKAGADIRSASTGSDELARSASATFSAPGRAPSGAVDGTTINEPFWGSAGSPNAKDALTVELDGEQTFDDVRVYFYDSSSSATAAGYQEPSLYTLEVRRDGVWSPIPAQARTPVNPRANLNQVQFPETTGDAVRITVTHAPGARTGIKEVQVSSTGVAAPAATNEAPAVTAWHDRSASVSGEAVLRGTAKDDGQPSGDLSTRWSLVSGPQDGVVVFEDDRSAATSARFSVEGDYVLRLTADDGERSSSADVTVAGKVATQGANIAPDATPSAEYTAGWTRLQALSDGKVVHAGGAQTDVWGTWSGSHPATRWVQYDWSEPVRIDGTELSFWRDQEAVGSTDGVNVPKAWKAQYWTGSEWREVPNPSGYGVERDAPNAVTFDPVVTQRLRVVLEAQGSGSTYAAVGASEWKVFAESPVTIEPIDVRTSVGVQPVLPATVDAVYEDGTRAQLPVRWPAVDDAQLAGETSFALAGVVSGATLPAKAQVWVRATAPGQINQVDAVAVSTRVGVAPQLPTAVGVLYNDGSREDLPVVWQTPAAADYAADGTFEVAGQVQSDRAGAKDAKAAVTVGGGSGPDTVAPTAEIATPAAPASGWFSGPVELRITASDDRPGDLRTEHRIDGGAWAPAGATLSIEGDGTRTIEVRATDQAGNVSAVRSATVRIDTAAPALEVATDAIARTARAVATDAASGVASVEYRLGEQGEWAPLTRTVQLPLDRTLVEVRATDRAGNVSAVVERDVPASQGDHRRNAALFATPSASYTSPWTRVTGLNDDVQPRGSGDQDPSDNAEVWGAWPRVDDQWVQYDWQSPVRIGELSAYFASNLDAQGLGLEVPAEWSAEYWDEASAAWTPVEPLGEYGSEEDAFNTVAFEPVTTTKLRLLLDPAGAEEQKGSVGVKEWQVWEAPGVQTPDTQAPTVLASVDPQTPASGWHAGDVRVVALAIDDRDATPRLEAQVGDAAWAPYTGAVAIVADGSTVVRFRAIDAAGNTSEPTVLEVRRDATRPTVDLAVDAVARTVTASGADAHSGIARLELRLGDGAWVTASGAVAIGDAAVTAQVRSVDVAGNVSEVLERRIGAKSTGGQPGGEQPGGPDGPGEPEPSGGLTGDEVLRIGVTKVAPGGTVPVSVTGAKPGTVFAVEFRSTPTRIGTLTVGADGAASGTFTVPLTAQAGQHTIALVSADGELTAPVEVVTPGATTPTRTGGGLPHTGASEGTPTVAWFGIGTVLLGLAILLRVRRRRLLG